MKVIIPFGPPNTGKGTLVSEFLKGREEQYEVLSVGNLLRTEVSNYTELGREAKAFMDSGALVPDRLIIAMVMGKVSQSKKDIFFDGFPRTVGQAKAMLEAGIKPDLVINLQVEEEVILKRARDRVICEKCGESYTQESDFKKPKIQGVCDKCGGNLKQRKDDADENVVKNRLKVYQAETSPVLEILASANVRICEIDSSSPTAIEEFKLLIV